jgi:anaerobic magnesium-protoporphyrin IX monomethyl ester cyclase
MKIALITPPLGVKNSGNRPIGLSYMKAVLKQNGYDAKVYDFSTMDSDAALNILSQGDYNVVGITVFTDTRQESIHFVKLLKKTECKVVLGGHHPTFLYKQIMSHYDFVDFIVLGEGEITFLELIKELDSGKDKFEAIHGLVFRRNGEYFVNAPRNPIGDIDSIPFPDYSDLEASKYKILYSLRYKRNYGVITSRSCSYSCEYCAHRWFSGAWRARSIENTIQEIERVYSEGFKHIWIIDDSFTEDPARSIGIFEGIIKRGMKISLAMNSRVNACNEDVLKIFKKAGGYRVDFGIESGSKKILELMNKRVNFDKAFEIADICRRLGITVKWNFILGYPGETAATFAQTKEVVKKLKPDILSVSVLRIFPGTPLYNRLIKENKVTENFWLDSNSSLHYFGESSYKEVMNRYMSLMFIWATQFRFKSILSFINFFYGFILANPKTPVYHLINTLKSMVIRKQ